MQRLRRNLEKVSYPRKGLCVDGADASQASRLARSLGAPKKPPPFTRGSVTSEVCAGSKERLSVVGCPFSDNCQLTTDN